MEFKNTETFKIEALVINIYKKNDNDALIKVMSINEIIFIYAKGFYMINSKNSKNIFVGSFSEFEIFKKYSNNSNYFLLKKANLLIFFDFFDKNNNFLTQNILNLFQKIELPSKAIYITFKEFLINNEINYEKNYVLTYLQNLVLKTNGIIFNNKKCSICKTSKNLYSIDLNEGGMLCFEHKTKKSINNLKIVKSFYYLDFPLQIYKNNTDEYSNNVLNKLFTNLF